MTASQRPEQVGRDALIEAAMAHVVDEFAEIYADERRGTNRWGMFCSCGWRTQLPKRDSVRMEQKRFEHQLDAILPLIADAIEELPLTYPLAAGQVRYNAARLVRSYLDGAQ